VWWTGRGGVVWRGGGERDHKCVSRLTRSTSTSPGSRQVVSPGPITPARAGHFQPQHPPKTSACVSAALVRARAETYITVKTCPADRFHPSRSGATPTRPVIRPSSYGRCSSCTIHVVLCIRTTSRTCVSAAGPAVPRVLLRGHTHTLANAVAPRV
jgi:hypothetical protein